MKRGAFPTMMKAMERKDFANWKQPLGFGDQKHITSGHDSYQWFSGAQLFGAVLGELIKGSVLTQNHVLVVVDGCLYDAETAKACLGQNCKQGNSQPRAIFLGLSWIQEKDLIRQGGSVGWTCSNLITALTSQALFTFVYSPHSRKTLIAIAACRRVIAENVSQAVAEVLKEKLRKKVYLMPSSVAIPEVSGVSGVSGGQNKEPPKYTPETFVLCQPRSNLELPLKETTVKQGKALPMSFDHDGEGMTWGKMEKKHNDEFNPSEHPWSPDQGQKRVAETDLQAAVGEKVVVEPASPPELLVPTGVSDPQGTFQILLDPNEGTPVLEGFEGWRSHKWGKIVFCQRSFQDCLCGSGRNGKGRGPVHWQ